MTPVPDASDADLSTAMDHVPGVRGHVVLAKGDDQTGEALAVWRVGPTGQAGGAWITPMDLVHDDAGRSRQIFDLLRDRCLVDWDGKRSAGVLDRVADLLPPGLAARMASNILLFPDLINEVAEQRRRLESTVEAYRAQTTSKILPLVWPQDIPEDAQQARQLVTGNTPLGASPVATEALALAGTLQRVCQLWQDTEQVRHRRSYLRDLGTPEPLPPTWLARLRAAAGPGDGKVA